MKLKIRIPFLFVLLYLILSSCNFSIKKEENHFIDNFRSNRKEFNDALRIIKRKYPLQDDIRLILFNCKDNSPYLKIHICDDSISNILSELNVEDVHIENEGRCSRSDSAHIRYYFGDQNSNMHEQWSYLYDDCDTLNENFYGNKYSEILLEKNWYLIKEEN